MKLKSKNDKRNLKLKLVSAQEIMKRHGITYQTVNHYTNSGLLQVVKKKGNVRMYDKLEVKQRLARIVQLMSEGYPLRLIKKQLEGV